MRIHAIFHAVYEELGFIRDWIQEKGHDLGESRLHAGEKLPSTDDFDMLVIMGGPMNAYDEAVRLASSKATINQAFIYKDRVLGIQFHTEIKPGNIRQMIDHAGNKLIPDQYIQTADTIENTTDYYDDGHKLCNN